MTLMPGLPRITWLMFAVIGAVVPLIPFGSWLLDNGVDTELFFDELFANRISTFFALDVVISAAVVLTLAGQFRGSLSRKQVALVVAGTLLVGVSLGLPLLLWFLSDSRSAFGHHQVPLQAGDQI